MVANGGQFSHHASFGKFLPPFLQKKITLFAKKSEIIGV